jgi:hypothetical protein
MGVSSFSSSSLVNELFAGGCSYSARAGVVTGEERRLGWRWRRGGSWTLLSFNEKRVGGQDCHDR